MHPVFHVSRLKKLVGSTGVSTQLPSVLDDELEKLPECILGRKMVKRQDRAATMVLIKWKNQSEDEATWEFLYDIQLKFPDFQT